jgi:hypothetical protein
MGQAGQQARIAPRVVSTIEHALSAHRAPRGADGSRNDPLEQLLSAMHTVKAARFNAAERLERKNMVSLFAMSMVSLYFVGLSVWQAIYAAQLDEQTGRLVTLVSIMSSMFTLILALLEAMNDYKLKAHHMHTCALAVNALLHELSLIRTSDSVLVQEFRKRYSRAVRSCPFNHARVDYLMARAEGGVPWIEKAWAQLRYLSDVYGLYGVCLSVPPLVLLLYH